MSGRLRNRNFQGSKPKLENERTQTLVFLKLMILEPDTGLLSVSPDKLKGSCWHGVGIDPLGGEDTWCRIF